MLLRENKKSCQRRLFLLPCSHVLPVHSALYDKVPDYHGLRSSGSVVVSKVQASRSQSRMVSKKRSIAAASSRETIFRKIRMPNEFDRASTIYDAILRQLAWLALHSNWDRRAFPFFHFCGAYRLMHFLSSRHSLKLISCCISQLSFFLRFPFLVSQSLRFVFLRL